MDYKYIERLKKGGKPNISLAGGKGATLIRLINSEIPVPEGFILLTSAYREYAHYNHIDKKIKELTETLSPDDIVGLEIASKTIKGLFTEGEFPDKMLNEIKFAYDKYAMESVAVRSSATAEDLPGTSFAGQYDTYLNIKGIQNVLLAIKNCFASLWNSRALSYRLKNGFNNESMAHAVIVQNLIEGEKSGIAFTANPFDGNDQEIIINASWGLGESIVSGSVNPDQWIIHKVTGEIMSEEISTKTTMTMGMEEEISTIQVPDQQKDKPSLNKQELKELHRLIIKTEACFDHPQDIEWTIKDGQVYILQSRDITSISRSDDEYDWNSSLLGNYLWTNGMVGDAFPEIVTPATWSLWETVMGGKVEGHPGIGNICGRIYANYSLIYSMLRKFGKSHDKALKLIDVMLNPKPENIQAPIISIDYWTIIFKIIPAEVKQSFYGRKILKELNTILEESPNKCSGILDDIRKEEEGLELTEIWKEKLYPQFVRLYYLQDKYNENFFMSYSKFKNDLEKTVGIELSTMIQSHISGGSQNLDSMGPLMGIIKVRNGDISKNEYINLYGHRHYNENELYEPKPYERTDWFANQDFSNDYHQINIREILEKRKNDSEVLWKKIEHKYPQNAKLLKKELNEMMEVMHVRENIRSELTRTVGCMRQCLLKAGELLKIDEDVFFMTISEILIALKGGTIKREYIGERKKKYNIYRSLPSYPQFIEGSFNPFSKKSFSNGMEKENDALSDSEKGVIKGCAASAGTVKGLVRRLNNPEEAHLLNPGEILVTTTTNIGWTPLFYSTAAVVTDVGAQLSHAAIVAREIGIPAVVGTGTATKSLET
ncbi:MAG: PEP/pyruvate-binding domain-containing protein, partial [Sedimentibacter sp.]